VAGFGTKNVNSAISTILAISPTLAPTWLEKKSPFIFTTGGFDTRLPVSNDHLAAGLVQRHIHFTPQVVPAIVWR